MNVAADFTRMTAADLVAVVALEQRLQRHPWTLGNFADSLVADHECWALRGAGVLVAFAVIMPTVDEVQLLNIGVAPERQRTGLGRSMLEFLCDRARQAGMARMLLEVRPSNTSAIAFYQHFDFVEIGRRRGYYPDSADREDAIVMAKQI